MYSKILKSFSFLFIFVFSLQSTTFASIALGTVVKTSQGFISVENLKAGDKVVAPNFKVLNKDGENKKDILSTKASLLEVVITNISNRVVDKVVLIKTDMGDMQTDEEQLFWEFENNSFVKAKDLKPGNIFINISDDAFDFCQCLAVVTLDSSTVLYDLTLEEPHIFFVSEAQILVHNFFPVLAIGLGIDFVFGSSLSSVAFAGLGACLGVLGVNILKISMDNNFQVSNPFNKVRKKHRWWRIHLWRHHKKRPGKEPGKGPNFSWEATIPAVIDKAEKEVEAVGDNVIRFTENNSMLNHMFRNSDGHIALDTPENRSLVESIIKDKVNFFGKDKYGTGWFAKIMEDGTQVWAKVRGNVIRDGGINKIPKVWDPQTGFCKNLIAENVKKV